MPTPKESDTPSRAQLDTLERMLFAEMLDVLVHPATVEYGRRVGMMRRGWIGTTYKPKKRVTIRDGWGPALVLTERGHAVVQKFSRKPEVAKFFEPPPACAAPSTMASTAAFNARQTHLGI